MSESAILLAITALLAAKSHSSSSFRKSLYVVCLFRRAGLGRKHRGETERRGEDTDKESAVAFDTAALEKATNFSKHLVESFSFVRILIRRFVSSSASVIWSAGRNN